MKHERSVLLMIGAVFILIGLVFVAWQGSTYTLQLRPYPAAEDVRDFAVEIEQEEEILCLKDQRLEEGVLYLTLQSLGKGTAYVSVKGPQEYAELEGVYVHSLGVITVGTYFGKASGTWIIPALAALYTALILCYEILHYRRGMKECLYQYRNVRSLGWIIYILPLLLGQIFSASGHDSLDYTVRGLLGLSSALSFIAFPLAFILSILVSVSNVELMRREGRNWKNMLGFFLGLLVCLGTILPRALSEYLQRSTLIDVHNERGWGVYAEMSVTNTALVLVTYLECILFATIILSLKAARKIPAFDRDCILILGCQITKAGTVTPLLQGRADRALDFARMQEDSQGPALLFIPSGGQGPDEVVPEAEAIRRYLREKGVPEDRILAEDQSANTYENLRNSAALIRERLGGREPRIAFSTTNYHVFRAGILARQLGLQAEGIGSPTRSYFWINAFIREFIATMYSERKKHALALVLMVALLHGAIFIVYLSNTL